MHATRLVELAAIVAEQHHFICRQPIGPDEWAADQFWVICRARLNEWARLLRNAESIKQFSAGFDATRFWADTQPVIEEVFFSEICTRVWCATLSVIEQQGQPGELDPIARSVFVSSLEARRRALRLILFAKGLPGVATSSVNQLRMQCEVWTDYLLSELGDTQLVQQYCFDRLRLKRIEQTRQNQTHLRTAKFRRSARFLAMRYALTTYPAGHAICGELNSEIASVIISCLPSAAFDGSGMQRLDLPVFAPSTDDLSLDILADLYGDRRPSRFDSQRRLPDNL